MDSAVQQAKKLVDRLRALQERRDAARETWSSLSAELERQAMAAGDIVQKALEKPGAGASAAIWVRRQEGKREGLTLTVFFGQRPERETNSVGEQQAEQDTNTQSLAMARFYLDACTCRVVGDRKKPGVLERDRRGRSGFKKFADLRDIEDISVSAFVRELLRFLEWASVGEGNENPTIRFSDRAPP